MRTLKTAATILVLCAAASLSLAADGLSAKEKAEGFQPLFDGKTLAGWDGDPELWSVRDGVLVGETTDQKKAKGNTFLIWKGGSPADFEVRFRFRLSGSNNSGFQYRSKDRGNWSVGGYQYDINRGPEHMGKLYDEKGKRGRMAMGGEKVVWKGKKNVVGPSADKEAVAKAEKRDDWNEGAIIATGNHLIHKLNGVVVMDLTDEEEEKRYTSGILAIQIHAGKPMKIEVKDIRLQVLK